MTDNSFAAKHPEDFERMAKALEDRANEWSWPQDNPNCEAAMQIALEAINAAGWILHPKPQRQVVHVGQAGERDGAG